MTTKNVTYFAYWFLLELIKVKVRKYVTLSVIVFPYIIL
jgi:hypothetical protein